MERSSLYRKVGWKREKMADRKQFLRGAPFDAALLKLIEDTRDIQLTPELLQEQRISFAFGNAMDNPAITKESVRRTAQSLGLAK